MTLPDPCTLPGARAQLLVPRLLDALAGGAAPQAAFADAWGAVPLATFLPWAPSMLSLLGAPAGVALLPALQVCFAVDWPPMEKCAAGSVRVLGFQRCSWGKALSQQHADADCCHAPQLTGLARGHAQAAQRP